MKKMHKFLLFVVCITFSANLLNAQNYYAEGDKTDLRNFLIQNSSIGGKTNGELLGLSAANLNLLSTDSNWINEENWVGKIFGLTWNWNAENPRRLTEITWNAKPLAGNLDLSNCTELISLGCSSNNLTNLDLSNCTELYEIGRAHV